MQSCHVGRTFFIGEINMQFKSQIMDSSAVMRALKRLSYEIIEKNHGIDNVCIVGIKRRGVPLAEVICENINQTEDTEILNGILDITLYRDDLSRENTEPVINSTDIPFVVTGKKIILVDDVIYTGRTVRAAIDALFSLGRPACIQLAVLVDRGHRELPIRPDYVGKNIPTSASEVVKVCTEEFDGKIGVELYLRD